MQVCKGCGREVKYIAVKDSYILCDAEEKDFVTENGYQKKGYEVHICKGDKDAKDIRQRES